MGVDQQEVLKWLVSVPVGDLNFKLRLGEATAETIRAALADVEGQPNSVTKLSALRSALRKAEKKGLDPDSEAALEVVEREQNRELSAKEEQADRERRIAEAHELAGRIQALSMVGKLVTVTNLVQLRQAKESKVYAEIPGIGTWEKYCNYLGLDRHTVDQHLLNLATFGEEFLVTATSLQVGMRELRKLRHLTHDGSMVVDAEAVVIGEERIPFDAAHREDLQDALEKLIETKDKIIEAKDATIRTKDKQLKSERELLATQERALSMFKREAKQRGFQPGEEAFLDQLSKHRTSFDGILSYLTPDASPVPPDATDRMKASYLEALGYMRRLIEAAHDTAVDTYGTSSADDSWVPPSMRPAEEG